MDGGEVGWLEKVVGGEGGGWRRWWVPLSQYTGSSVKISMKTNEPFHHTILLCTKGTGCRGGEAGGRGNNSHNSQHAYATIGLTCIESITNTRTSGPRSDRRSTSLKGGGAVTKRVR